MKEKFPQTFESVESLELKDLKIGDIVQVDTGLGDEAWHYCFTVENAGPKVHWPTGTLVAINPAGEPTEPTAFSIHGSGRWTDRKQNIVQKQEIGFSSYFDCIYLGEYLVGKVEGLEGRAVFDKRDQEISAILIKRGAKLAKAKS